MRVWDNTEQAWRCTFDDDLGAIPLGLAQVFYIPSGATIKARGTIKLDPAFNGTAPILEIRGSIDRVYVGANGSYSGDQPFRGYSSNVSFNATNTTSYQTVELEFPSKPWGRAITISIVNLNSNASEGWWEKPIDLIFDQLPDIQFISTGFNSFDTNYYTDTYFNEKKIRLGGRLN